MKQNIKKSQTRSVFDDNGRFHHRIKSICQSRQFTAFIAVILLLDHVLLHQVNDPTLKDVPAFFEIANTFFLLVYVMEIVMKVSGDPRDYWNRRLNFLVFVVVLASCICVFVGISMQDAIILRVLLSLRVLNTLPDPVLQKVVEAYWIATRISISVIGVMFVAIMMYAVIAHDLFSAADPDNWGDLSTILFNLFSLATMKKWANIQKKHLELGLNSSWVFTISFIILMHGLFKLVIVVFRVLRNNAFRSANTSDISEVNTTMKNPFQEQGNIGTEGVKTQLERIEKSLTRQRVKVESKYCSVSTVTAQLVALKQRNEISVKLQQLYREMTEVLGKLLQMKMNEEVKKDE